MAWQRQQLLAAAKLPPPLSSYNSRCVVYGVQLQACAPICSMPPHTILPLCLRKLRAVLQLAALHTQQRKQVLPRLAALLEEAQQAQAFAKTEVTTDIAHLWEMPAQHLVPARTCEPRVLCRLHVCACACACMPEPAAHACFVRLQWACFAGGCRRCATGTVVAAAALLLQTRARAAATG